MPSIGYQDTRAFLIWSGQTYRMNGLVEYVSASRTNNTVNINSARGVYQVTGPSGYWFSGFDVTVAYAFPSSTARRIQSLGTGRRNVGDVVASNYDSFSYGVGASDIFSPVRAGASYAGDPVTWADGASITIPALGTPSAGTPSVSDIGVTGAKVNYSGSAGTNATFSSMRIDYGKTSGYGSSSTSGSASGSFSLSNLTPGTTYHYKLTATNGGGKVSSTGDRTFTLLPAPNTNSTLLSVLGVL